MADRASCLTMSWQLARSGRRPTSSCMTARGWPRSGGRWVAIYFTGMTLVEAESGEEPPVEWVTPALTIKRRARGGEAAVVREPRRHARTTAGLGQTHQQPSRLGPDRHRWRGRAPDRPKGLEAAMGATRLSRATAIGIEAGGCVAVLWPGQPAAARLERGGGTSVAPRSSS